MENSDVDAFYKVFEAAKNKRNSSSSSGRIGTEKMSVSYTNWSDQNHIPTAWDSISPKARLNIERVAKEAAQARNRRYTKQERRLSISSPTVSSEESSTSSCSNSTTKRYKHSRSASSAQNQPSLRDPEIYKYLDEAIQKHANRFQIKHQKKSPRRNKSRSITEKASSNRDRHSSKMLNKKHVPEDRDAYTNNIFMESFVKFCSQLQDAKFLEGRKKAARGNTSKKKDSSSYKYENGPSNIDNYGTSSSCNPSKSRRAREKHCSPRPERKDSIIDDIARLLKKLYFKSFDKLFDNKNTPMYHDHLYSGEEGCQKKMLPKVFQNSQEPFDKRQMAKVCEDKCVETDYGMSGNRNTDTVRRQNIKSSCNEGGDGYRYPQRFIDQSATWNGIRNDYAPRQEYADNASNNYNRPSHRGTGNDRLNSDRSHENLSDKQGKEQRECMEKMAKLWEEMLVKFKDVTKAVGDSDRYIQEAVEQQRNEMTETVHLWRECMRRYELLNRDMDDKDCAYQEQVKNQKEEMHEQTKMWQDCLSKYREINDNLTKLSHKISNQKTNPPSKTPPNRNPLPEPPPRPPPPILPSYPPQYSYTPAVPFHPFYSRQIMRPPLVPMWQPRFPPVEPCGQGRNCNPYLRGFHDPRHGHHCPSGCRCRGSKEQFWNMETPPVLRRCRDPRHGQNCTRCYERLEETKERLRDRRTSPRFRIGRRENIREGCGRRDSTSTSSGSDSSRRERELRRGAIRKERSSRSDAGHKAFEEIQRKGKCKHNPCGQHTLTSARNEPRRYCNR